MDRLPRLLRIYQQVSIVCADVNVLVSVFDLNQFRFGISLKFFRHCVYQWHEFFCLVACMMHLVSRNEMHRHRDDRGRHPNMDVLPPASRLVNIDTEHPFAEGVSPCQQHCGPETQSNFRKQYHVAYPSVLRADRAGL